MTETMLERAARGIYARKYADHDPWDEATARAQRLGMSGLSLNQKEAIADARSALEAIREPSKEDSLGVFVSFSNDDEATWREMIDAILSQSQEGREQP